MKSPLYLLVVFSLFFVACQSNPIEENIEQEQTESPEISFYTSDSLLIKGDLHLIDKQNRSILLFHQAGANARSEYGPIIPQLKEAGFNVLAIDQRSGGQRFGQYNRTIAPFTKNDFSFCDAFADLEAALNYLIEEGFSGSKIVWGSSYSASLAIQLANKRQGDVSAVQAFSPASGGPMAACKPDEYFETLDIPLLLLRPSGEMEIESVQNQFNLAQEHGHQTYIAENGTHGSSMLVEERVGNTVDANWDQVMGFLENIGSN